MRALAFPVALSIALVGACARTTSPERVELPAASGLARPPPPASASAPAAGARGAKRCLPVVAAECGCVWSCAVGIESSPGTWSVTHPHWGGTPLTAKIGPWCEGGDCTDAFLADIVCDAICAPKPADHGCHFDDERCTGS